MLIGGDDAEGDAMRFIQLIEFRGDQDEFDRLMERYREIMGSETTARRATLCADRDQPGVLLELVEFDSHEEAMANSEHPGTQRWAAEATELLGQATFRNLDVVGEYTM